MQVAYQGVPGAYSEMAARTLFGPRSRMLPQPTFEAVFAAVHRGAAGAGVLPIENSLAGSIHQNYDLLLKHRLYVTGETYVRIDHALLARPGTTFSAVREVRSHPQALAQCGDFFSDHPRLRPVAWFDTAGAAQSLTKETSTPVAAIAGEGAAQLYHLVVLRRHLQNRARNFTRFLAVARQPARGVTGPLKTSITFIPRRNQAGSLFRLLGAFAAHAIDLTKIESRPDPENPFAYRFYLDFAGGAADPEVHATLDQLRGLTRSLRMLGSYARARLDTPPPPGKGRKPSATRRTPKQ